MDQQKGSCTTYCKQVVSQTSYRYVLNLWTDASRSSCLYLSRYLVSYCLLPYQLSFLKIHSQQEMRKRSPSSFRNVFRILKRWGACFWTQGSSITGVLQALTTPGGRYFGTYGLFLREFIELGMWNPFRTAAFKSVQKFRTRRSPLVLQS